ncbi:hypothetical protein ACFPWR_04435 [Algoriphagus winogradskyi]
MTRQDNFDWLKKVNALDNKSQFESIRQRLLINRKATTIDQNLDSPIFIVDGILITDTVNLKTQNFLINKLTFENTYIVILEQQTEEFIWCKPFTGVIAMRITDNKMRKEFKKIK